MNEQQPIFLLADSQLLFWKNKNGLFLNRIFQCFNKDKKTENIKASYIGASNGDDPAYYDVFKTAMAQICLTNCRMIPSNPDTADMDFLRLSDLILLAGGELKRGMDVIKRNDFDKIIVERYQKGSVIIGLSAGAVQLGGKAREEKENQEKLTDTLGIVPYIIDVHNEQEDWKLLNTSVESENEHSKGFGIPSGGGIIFYPDWSLEAVRHSLTEIVVCKEGKNRKSLILPPT